MAIEALYRCLLKSEFLKRRAKQLAAP